MGPYIYSFYSTDTDYDWWIKFVMKQYEAVIKIMDMNGGYATLGHLNQNVLKIKGCAWSTKTPFASIRRIVQDQRFFFKIRPGLWALKTYKDKLPPEILPVMVEPNMKQKEYTHTYYQGLLVELGNMEKYMTFVQTKIKTSSIWKRNFVKLQRLLIYINFPVTVWSV